MHGDIIIERPCTEIIIHDDIIIERPCTEIIIHAIYSHGK